MKDYILFIPPEQVINAKARNWSVDDAKVYFEWLMSVKDDRVDYLLTSIDETLTGDDAMDIKRIGERVTILLRTPPFSDFVDNQLTITNKGLALAADISLLISNLIVARYPQIKWQIVKKPKNDISYNRPAIFGFKPMIGHLELMGGSITTAKAILRGEKTEAIWPDIYNYAVSLIS